MSRAVINITIVLIYCSGVKLQVIDNSINFWHQDKYGTDFFVEKHKSLHIGLYNFSAEYIRCLSFHYTGPSDVFVEQHLSGERDSMINVQKIVDNMNTKWWCLVLQKYNGGLIYKQSGKNYSSNNIAFNLHLNRVGAKNNNQFDYKLLYIATGVALVMILILIIVIIVVKHRNNKKSSPQLQLGVINPDSVFYQNLEIFRRHYERQFQEPEPEYEVID